MTIAAAIYKDEEKIRNAFGTGHGFGWHEHHHDLFHGTERLFKPGYSATSSRPWIPALDDVDGKLQAGAKVADIGCGHGSSTILLAQAVPQLRPSSASTTTRLDRHRPQARRRGRRRRSCALRGRLRAGLPRRPTTTSSASSTRSTTWATPACAPAHP